MHNWEINKLSFPWKIFVSVIEYHYVKLETAMDQTMNEEQKEEELNAKKYSA